MSELNAETIRQAFQGILGFVGDNLAIIMSSKTSSEVENMLNSNKVVFKKVVITTEEGCGRAIRIYSPQTHVFHEFGKSSMCIDVYPEHEHEQYDTAPVAVNIRLGDNGEKDNE